MKSRLLRGILLYLLAVVPGAACAEASRDFASSSDGSTGTGDEASSTSSGMGGQPGASGGGMGGQLGAGGSGSGSLAGGGGVGGAGGGGGAGGQAAPCTWIDITMADCSSGIKIADFCPPGSHVSQLERCNDGTFFTPDAAYQMFKLSGCSDVCPVVPDHVAWRKIECCM